jgi:hypothetical protein
MISFGKVPPFVSHNTKHAAPPSAAAFKVANACAEESLYPSKKCSAS